MMGEDFVKQVHDANIAFYRVWAEYYDRAHRDIFNAMEQKRTVNVLRLADGLVSDNCKRALDFGAGTGNIAGKLLDMGYQVTAVDISKEMCEILKARYRDSIKNGRLNVVTSEIEDVIFREEEFDLIVCYSVLHHLPDYVGTIRKLAGFLKRGGVMCLDHEASPIRWIRFDKKCERVRSALHFSDSLLNRFFSLVSWGHEFPVIDHSMADYWAKHKHHIDHVKIGEVFKQEHFSYFQRHDYYDRQCDLFNPLWHVYKRLYAPDTSLWIAKK